MPIVIEEVIAELQEDTRAASAESAPAPAAQPVPAPDKDLARALALLQERQERLRVD
jgi:hypothetical protein